MRYLFACAALSLAACGGTVVDPNATPSSAPSAPPLQAVVASEVVITGSEQRITLGILDRDGLPVPDATVTAQIFNVPAPGSGATPAAVGPPQQAPYKGALMQGRGVYVLHQTFSQPGFYRVTVSAQKGPLKSTTEASFQVRATDPTIPLGSPAPRTSNATAAQVDDIRKIDTSGKDDGMHYISVAGAIAAQHVVVVYLGSPGFCVSKQCAPEVDAVKALMPKYQAQGVDFVHIETYKDGTPNSKRDNFNPWFDEWKVPTDPWVFIVGRDGNVRAKFEGPTPADELEPALAASLS